MCVIITLLALILQSPPQTSLGAIEGTVTRTGATGTPIAGAHVKLSDSRQASPAVVAETTTDGTGHFNVRDVPAGLYVIEIGHEAFGYRGTPVRNGMFWDTITVSAGQVVRVPPVSLIPAGAIYGRVLDVDGNGVSSARVEILRATMDERGRKIWNVVSGRVLTDDQGAYRQRLVGSGDYYVRAVLESGPIPLTIYYPETMESSKAAPVIFSEGSEIAADIRIGSAPTEGFQISGRVMLPQLDVASPFIELVLAKRDPKGPIETSPATDVRGSTRASDGIGNFEFRGIRTGNYELSANARIDGRSYTGKVLIDVRDGDLDNIELSVRPPVEVKGRLLIDGDPKNIRLSRRTTDAVGLNSGNDASEVVLALSPMSISTDLSRLRSPNIDPTGTSFSFGEIPEGDYRISVLFLTDGKPSQDLYIADIRTGGRSVIDSGFQVGLDVVDSMEVVVGTKPGSIEGRIAGNGSNSPAALVLIPETSRRSNASLYRIIYLVSGDQFQIPGITPGNYKVFAVPSLSEPTPYRSSEFIGRYESRALSVTVEKGTTSRGLQIPYLDK